MKMKKKVGKMKMKKIRESIMTFLFGEKEEDEFGYRFAMLQQTNPAKNNFINDEFNKKICIYKSYKDYKNKKPEREMPYTEADIKNVKKVWNIPIIQEVIDTEIEFGQESNFGEVVNKI